MSGDSTDGIYSEKQIAFVDSISDERLRSQLLHTVMLGDRMQDDRDCCLQSLYKEEDRVTQLRAQIRQMDAEPVC